jgi:hypothetical protein
MLWRETVDELFTGPVAEQAKTHATRVGAAFERRLQGLPDEPGAPVGLQISVHVPRRA